MTEPLLGSGELSTGRKTNKLDEQYNNLLVAIAELDFNYEHGDVDDFVDVVLDAARKMKVYRDVFEDVKGSYEDEEGIEDE